MNKPRYFVVSRQDNIIRGTKESGYVRFRSAVNARARIDERDAKNASGFTPMLVVKA